MITPSSLVRRGAAPVAYAALLAGNARPQDHGPVPTFDVCLLGLGEEGHVASVFPHSPAVYETERTVVGVHGCPKPPPTRVSLTLPAARHAREVWLVAAGEGKAESIGRAYEGASEVDVPLAGLRGTERTLCSSACTSARPRPRKSCPPSRPRTPTESLSSTSRPRPS